MKATGKKINAYTYEIIIQESAAEMEHYKKIAAKKIAESRQFPGFRKGDDVPVEVVAREIGEHVLMGESVESALQSLYPKALKKLGIHPVDIGEVKKIHSSSPLDVVLELEIAPDVELAIKKIEKIHISLDTVNVTDDELDKEIQAISERYTHYHPRGHDHGHHHDENGDVETVSDTAIHEGDRVRVNALGYDKKDGTPDERMALRDFDFVVGAHVMIPGFEEALIGAKEGDVVEFDVTFPKEYHSADFAGKNGFFSVTVLSVEYPHKPDWSEEFIERIWGKKLSVSDFRVEYREAMLADKKDKARSNAEEKLSTELIALHSLEIGPKMLAREVENLWLHHNREIERQGMDQKTYLEHLKTTEEAFKKEHIEPAAMRRIQSMLLMEALKNHYKPQVTEENVLGELKKMFSRHSGDAEFESRILEMAKPGTEHFHDIKSRLEYRVVIDRFIK